MNKLRYLLSRLRPTGYADAPTPSSPPALFWAAFAALLLVQSLLFLLTTTPALLDYPNHLARVFILEHWRSDPFLHQYYQPNWAALPNLAFDGLGLALGSVLPIFRAGQVALLGAVALLASGLAALNAVLHDGRPRPFCLVGFLFVFSEPFAWGFVSLVLGFGLVLWGVAIWLRLRSRPWPIVLAWSAPFALALFFAHLFAFGSYAVTVAGIEMAMAGTAVRGGARPIATYGRAALVGGAQFIVPAAVFLLASPTPLGGEAVDFGSLLDRARSLPLAPVRNFDDALDSATVAIVAALVVGGLWTRRLRIAREMRVALVMLALLCLAIPHRLASSETAEIRLPVILMLLLAASGDWRAPRRAVLAGGAALALLFAVRTATVEAAFARGDRFTAALRDALAGLPRGVRVASVTVTSPAEHRIEGAWQHAICYEVIDDSALVPSVFAFTGQQPLRLGAAFRDAVFPPVHYASRAGQMLPASRFAQVDYVVLVHPAGLQAALPSTLRPVVEKPEFRLFHVVGKRGASNRSSGGANRSA